jgi:GntR family transcriptional regulator
MSWKFVGGVPLATQIADRLREAILQGDYPIGSTFPPVRTLAEVTSVNPNTVQRALWILEEEGLLVTRTTVGRFVTEDEAVIRAAQEKSTEKLILEFIQRAKKKNLQCDQVIDCIRREWI